MSSLPVIVLISLTLFMWAVAIWASIEEEQEAPTEPPQKKETKKEQKPEQEDQSTHGRKVA